MGMMVVREMHWCMEGDLPDEHGLVLEYQGRYHAVAAVRDGELQVIGSASTKDGAKLKLQEHWADNQRRAAWERGQTLAEYAVVLAVIVIIVVGVVWLVR